MAAWLHHAGWRVACCCFLINIMIDLIRKQPSASSLSCSSSLQTHASTASRTHVELECFTQGPCKLLVTPIESSVHSSVWRTGGPAGLQCALWASALLGAKLSHPLTRGSNFSVPLSLQKKSHLSRLPFFLFSHCAIQISLSPPTLAGRKQGDAKSRKYSFFKKKENL